MRSILSALLFFTMQYVANGNTCADLNDNYRHRKELSCPPFHTFDPTKTGDNINDIQKFQQACCVAGPTTITLNDASSLDIFKQVKQNMYRVPEQIYDTGSSCAEDCTKKCILKGLCEAANTDDIEAVSAKEDGRGHVILSMNVFGDVSDTLDATVPFATGDSFTLLGDVDADVSYVQIQGVEGNTVILDSLQTGADDTAVQDAALHRGMELTLAGNGRTAIRRWKYMLPIRLPCWVRRIRINLFGIELIFPVFGWSRRCCGRETGFGTWKWNANVGCHQSGSGPFLSETQCERICPAVPGGDSCEFGDGSEWPDGHSETNCAGATCTCNDGVVTCDDCRYRYEIHDVAIDDDPNTSGDFEEEVVNALKWVSGGCDGTCTGWLQNAMANHLTYGGVAHGNSKFFPWHRAYLKTLEEKMQLYSPCVTIPWWDWTQDQTSTSPHNFGWTQQTSGGNEGLWGYINGNQVTDMGAFEDDPAYHPEWEVPSGWPAHSRSSSMNPSSSLPSTGTIINYLARSSFGSPDNFKSFESPHGSPHVMIGGNMGNGRSPADPVFWLHHAGVDRLWYDWQLLHGLANYDDDPNEVMNPFAPWTPNDMFDSRHGVVGVCYAPAGTPVPVGVPAPGTRRRLSERRLATAIEYGLIASMASFEGSLVKAVRKNRAFLHEKLEDTQNNAECNNPVKQSCGNDGKTCFVCLDAENGICADDWWNNMQIDAQTAAINRCQVDTFNADSDIQAFVARETLVKEASVKNDRKPLLKALNSEEKLLDVDGDGAVDALSDGLMLLRKLFDVPLEGVTVGAIRTGGDADHAHEVLNIYT